MINKEAPTTDPTMTPIGIPAGNINSKEKVKQHAILFIDLGKVFMSIEVEMDVRQHMTPTEQNPGTSNVLNKLRFNCDEWNPSAFKTTTPEFETALTVW